MLSALASSPAGLQVFRLDANLLHVIEILWKETVLRLYLYYSLHSFYLYHNKPHKFFVKKKKVRVNYTFAYHITSKIVLVNYQSKSQRKGC